MKKILLISMLFSFAALSFAQSAKTIRTYGIERKVETAVKYHKGEEVARFIEEIEVYNKEGDWVEKYLFDSAGELKSEEYRVYENGEVVDETSIDHNGSRAKEAKPPSYERVLFVYDKDDLLEEEEVDQTGKTIRKKKYLYNKFGDVEETTLTDSEGNLVEKELTEYDNRGLKIKETVYQGNGKIKSEKIFSYE
jgi:hypothetical protein